MTIASARCRWAEVKCGSSSKARSKVSRARGMSFWKARKLNAKLYWSFAARFADGIEPSINKPGLDWNMSKLPAPRAVKARMVAAIRHRYLSVMAFHPRGTGEFSRALSTLWFASATIESESDAALDECVPTTAAAERD